MKALITQFSTPSGFPSHINAQIPGAIHEGCELGYALSVSFGAVMDYPDLIVTCMSVTVRPSPDQQQLSGTATNSLIPKSLAVWTSGS